MAIFRPNMQNLNELFDAIDRMDAAGFASFLTEDAVFRFGSAESVRGQANIQKSVEGFFSSIAGIKHRIINVWENQKGVSIQGEVTYTRKDGKAIILPFANVFRMQGSLIREYLIYVDISPLYAP